MRLMVSDGQVVIDAEREQALRDFASGMALPPPQQRSVNAMLCWLDLAISRLNPDDDLDAIRYAGLVLDKQYLRLVAQGLLPEQG